MNNKTLLMSWSIFCVPIILMISMNYIYGAEDETQTIYLWGQFIAVLSGIIAISLISIKHLVLKVFAVGLYLFAILFIWLAIGMTIGCQNGRGCFVH